MRAEKQIITAEYVARLQASPYFLVVDYRGLSVGQFTELRKRLGGAGSEVHVVKNSIFRVAAKQAGVADVGSALDGQLAVITGEKDISMAAKIVKTFHAEFEKPKFRFGYLNDQRLDAAQIQTLADLPSLDVLRGTLAGLLQAPASKLVRLVRTPAEQLTRVLKAHAEKA